MPMGTFWKPRSSLKTADVWAFSVVWKRSQATPYFLKLQCCFWLSWFKTMTNICLFSKSALHWLLLWRNPKVCLCWRLWLGFCALILFPLPLHVGTSTKGVWAQEQELGGKTPGALHTAGHVLGAPQSAGLLHAKTELGGSVTQTVKSKQSFLLRSPPVRSASHLAAETRWKSWSRDYSHEHTSPFKAVAPLLSEQQSSQWMSSPDQSDNHLLLQ